jgi:hypothetical protein
MIHKSFAYSRKKNITTTYHGLEKSAAAEGTLEVDRKQEETPIVDSNIPQKCTEVDNIYLMVSILYAITCRRIGYCLFFPETRRGTVPSRNQI